MTEKIHICYHVDVTDLVPELGSARFVFKTKVSAADSETAESGEIEIFMPYQVLQSIAGTMPELLQHMRDAGCDAAFNTSPQRPS